MTGILGKKLGMSQIFDEKGFLIPVTLVQAGPCPILQTKTKESDGYNAILIGFDPKAVRKCTKPEIGLYESIAKRLKGDQKEESQSEEAKQDTPKEKSKKKVKLVVEPMKFTKEIKVDNPQEFKIGQIINVDVFKEGDRIDVVGISKGRGFAGSIKRFHTHRGPETHGSMYHRRTGSLGQSSAPSRVYKGKPMPGHMGNSRVTVSNLQVIKTDKEKNILFIKGSVPGHPNQYLVINIAKKILKNKASDKK